MEAFRPKRCLLSLVFSAVSFLFFLSPASADIHGTQDIGAVYSSVKGNPGDSFYPASRDWNFQYNGSLRFKETVGDREYSGAFDYKYNGDGTAEPRRFAIERMTFGLKQGLSEFQLGDYYANFSEYSLANALKGIRYSYGDPEFRGITLVAGVDTQSWENLVTDRPVGGTSGKRYVWGARVENPVAGGRGLLGFNYAGGLDDASFVAQGQAPMRINVLSVDGRYKLTDNLDVNGEVAGSLTDENTRAPGGTVAAAAAKVGFDLHLPHYSLHTLYRRTGEHFHAVSGFNGNETGRLDLEGRREFSRGVFNHYFHYILGSRLSGGVREYNPGANISLAMPMGMTWELGADLRRRYSADRSTDNTTGTLRAALSRQYRHFRPHLAYSLTSVDDRAAAGQSRNIHSLEFGCDGTYTIRDVEIGWNVGQGIQSTRYRSGGSDDSFVTTAGVKAQFPSSLMVEARASLGASDYRDSGSDTSSGLYLGVSRTIREGMSFTVSCERKKHAFQDSVNNFTENVVKAAVHYSF